MRRLVYVSVLLAILFFSITPCSIDVNKYVRPFFSLFTPVAQANTTGSQAVKRSKKNIPDGTNFLATASMELYKVKLIDFLERYSEHYDFEFFIDRRVDPTVKLSGSFVDDTFVTALDKMLNDVGLSFCIVDNSFLYIGPNDAAGEALVLFTIKRNRTKSVPRLVADKLSSNIDFEIEPYSQPKEVFDALSQKSKVKFSGFDKTPFDRWRGASFQHVVIQDLLTVMALGFNVEYKYDSESGTIKPVALNRSQSVMRHYPRVFGLQIDKTKHPDCSFEESQDENGEPSIYVTGRFQDMAKVEYEYSRIRRKEWSEQTIAELNADNLPEAMEVKNSSSSKRSHIEVSGSIANKTLGDIFDYLKKTSKIRCVLDPSMESVGISLETRISCEFKHSDVKAIANIIAVKIGAQTMIEGAKITFYKN